MRVRSERKRKKSIRGISDMLYVGGLRYDGRIGYPPPMIHLSDSLICFLVAHFTL